jgi:ribosomal protein S18 acetylase RimI-like enzyme
MIAISVRRMQCTDVPACVDIHLRAFKGFFLSFLGKQFLNELYASITGDPSGIGYIAEVQGCVRGFVIGTSQPSGLYKRLLQKRWWIFCRASLIALIKRPTILPRLLRAFTMPGHQKEARSCGTLMSIAVDPQSQGNKIGHLLVQAFLDEAARRGLSQVNLTTDHGNNDYANRFYQHVGFLLLRQYMTPEGRQMNEYIYAFHPATISEA